MVQGNIAKRQQLNGMIKFEDTIASWDDCNSSAYHWTDERKNHLEYQASGGGGRISPRLLTIHFNTRTMYMTIPVKIFLMQSIVVDFH